MKVLIINSVCGVRSTGRICTDIAEALIKKGNEVKIAYGREHAPGQFDSISRRIGKDCDVKEHAIETKIFDNHGLASRATTKRFLMWASEYNPDLVWLHNIHGYYINYELLFDWIKSRPEMEVRWTLHDCWAFTGHCAYFTIARCEKWKSGCGNCPQKKEYPASVFLDNSRRNYDRKKKAFTGVNRMTLITPSKWLADLTRESFLKDYPVEVHNNSVDRSIFFHRESDFRDRFSLQYYKIVLGVASPWSDRKGLKDFLKLSEIIPDDYRIVLVGLNKAQIKKLPDKVIGITRTNNAIELAEIYSSVDVFVNPTYEDNYPTTNLEARACGIPVITYNTGGSPESVEPQNVIEAGDIIRLKKRILEICQDYSFEGDGL